MHGEAIWREARSWHSNRTLHRLYPGILISNRWEIQARGSRQEETWAPIHQGFRSSQTRCSEKKCKEFHNLSHRQEVEKVGAGGLEFQVRQEFWGKRALNATSHFQVRTSNARHSPPGLLGGQEQHSHGKAITPVSEVPPSILRGGT